MQITGYLSTQKNRLSTASSLFLLLLLLLLPLLPASAADTDKAALGGFLSARLGSSVEAVLAAIEKDNIQITEDEVKSGARQIRGRYKGPFSTNQILYVLPEEHKKLALIIEFYSNPDYYTQVVEDLTKQLGNPLGDEITNRTLAATDKLPRGIRALTLWALKAGDVNLMVRAMKFDNYLAVERLDDRLLK